MDIYVLNKQYQKIAVVDVFESFLWIERYTAFGEFELYTPVSLELLSLLQEDFYIQIAESEKTMIIESIEIKTDVERGNRLVVRGRSLESVLDRRIVFSQIQHTNTYVQDVIWDVLNKCLIGPVQPPFANNRIVSNMIFEYNNDASLFSLLSTVQYRGENVYEIVKGLCESHSLGFRLLLNSSNQLVFSIYKGINRSYNQSENPYVVFSPNFDNLINSNYFHSKAKWKSANMVLGDSSDGVSVIGFAWGFGANNLFGIDHREVLIDLSHVSKYVEGTSTPINPSTYLSQIIYLSGLIRVNEHGTLEEFEGQADTTNSFKYRQDFFLGDIVQIENEYGIQGRARITEVTISENPSGYYIFPTFEMV